MPDPKQMSGVPLPVDDMTAGSVSVRVIRGSLDEPPAGSAGGPPGRRHADGHDQRRRTSGVHGLTPGTRVKASPWSTASVSSRRSSRCRGGRRSRHARGDRSRIEKHVGEDRPLAQAPAQPGTVVLGDQTRFVFEMGDDGLTGFYLLHILNTARTPVQAADVVVDLPDGGGQRHDAGRVVAARRPSPARRVTVTGPFAPGVTQVQIAFTLPYSGGTLTVDQNVAAAAHPGYACSRRRSGDAADVAADAAASRHAGGRPHLYRSGRGPRSRPVRRCRSRSADCRTDPRGHATSRWRWRWPILGLGIWASVRPGPPRAAETSAATSWTRAATVCSRNSPRSKSSSGRERSTASGTQRSAATWWRARARLRASSTRKQRRSHGFGMDFTSLTFTDVSRNFGRRRALNRVSFQCAPARSSRSSGRTAPASRRCCRSRRRCSEPTSGIVRYGDHTAEAAGAALRARIGLLGHDLYVYPDLSAAENLDFFGRSTASPTSTARSTMRSSAPS